MSEVQHHNLTRNSEKSKRNTNYLNGEKTDYFKKRPKKELTIFNITQLYYIYKEINTEIELWNNGLQ